MSVLLSRIGPPGTTLQFCADAACERREAVHHDGVCGNAAKHRGHRSLLCFRDSHGLCVGCGCRCHDERSVA